MELFDKKLNATDAEVILASNSPRRRQLLEIIQPVFAIAHSKDIDESFPDDLQPEDVPVFLSKLKSDAYRDILKPREIIITADTVVINEGAILGKPHSEQEAIDMLKSLRDKTHKVVTGVTLCSVKKTLSFAETTMVTFGRLSDDEIVDYVRCYKPMDKAGAYGIQEWIGCVGISSINGCFYNVMGLPLYSLYAKLKDFPY